MLIENPSKGKGKMVCGVASLLEGFVFPPLFILGILLIVLGKAQ